MKSLYNAAIVTYCEAKIISECCYTSLKDFHSIIFSTHLSNDHIFTSANTRRKIYVEKYTAKNIRRKIHGEKYTAENIRRKIYGGINYYALDKKCHSNYTQRFW